MSHQWPQRVHTRALVIDAAILGATALWLFASPPKGLTGWWWSAHVAGLTTMALWCGLAALAAWLVSNPTNAPKNG